MGCLATFRCSSGSSSVLQQSWGWFLLSSVSRVVDAHKGVWLSGHLRVHYLQLNPATSNFAPRLQPWSHNKFSFPDKIADNIKRVQQQQQQQTGETGLLDLLLQSLTSVRVLSHLGCPSSSRQIHLPSFEPTKQVTNNPTALSFFKL